MTLQECRQKVDNLKGRKSQITKDLHAATTLSNALELAIKDTEEAQIRIQAVAKATQEQLEIFISAPVTAAQAGVFDDPYEFLLRFEVRRGQTEGDLIFVRDGKEIKDLTFGGGGGEVDVAAYGLQIAGWSLSNTAPFLMLDEPLKWLKSRDKTFEVRGSTMLRETSQQVGLQILMISHIPEQQKAADKIFEFELIDKVSVLKE